MKSLIATGALIRLALRRDRIKLPLWIVGIAGAMAANVPAVIDFYGKDYQSQLTYAATTAPSVVSRVFGGPIHGPELGEIVMNETFLFTAVAVAFMSTLAVVRHTRQNEETGRAELIGSGVVGHQASLTAALVVTLGANIVLGALLAGIYALHDLPLAGSLAAGAAFVGVGTVFAGVAALTAQLSESARGANSLAAAVLGVVFLLRALGDGMGKLINNGLGIASAWPSWLSPIGWGQQMYPFSEERWWILSLFGVLAVGLLSTAFALNAHRDQGLGMIPTRRGPARAPKRLLSPLGLAWRLQRGTLRGWAIGVAVMGVSIGFIADEFKDLFANNDEVAEFLKTADTNASFTDVFFAAMMGLMGIALAGYVVQALLRMRSEESSGHLEPVLATAVSRVHWMMTHVLLTVGGAIFLLLLLGATSGGTYALITHANWSDSFEVIKAALVYVPAIMAFAGFVVAVFGILPRLAMGVGWTAFAFCYLLAQFGTILKLPRAILNISPFAHIPAVPIDALRFRPLVSLFVIALVLILAGLVFFRRRDLTTA